VELIQEGVGIHKLIKYIWKKEELLDQWKGTIILPIHKNGDELNVISIVGYHYYQLYTKVCRKLFSQG
jgi:hypothetical protein